MPKKLTQQQVEQEFATKGCKLLEQYEGNQKSMKYRCKCGEIAQTSLVGFRKSDGCYKCSEASAGRKFTYDEVKQCFLDQGCELLDTEYPNNGVLLNYRCSCGCVSKVRFRDFKNGRRCLKCKGDKISGKLRTSEDDIFKLCEEHGCKLIRSWIHDKRSRIEYVCKCGRVAEAYWTNFNKFPNCWECGKDKKSGSNCYMYDPDREAVEMRKKFRKMCGQHIRRFMKATGEKKTHRTHELLGYTPQELQNHILNHPEYEKVKGGVWHVDHILPLKALIDHGIFDLKIINASENLRPMAGPENLSKSDKYNKEMFLRWLGET